MTEETLTKLSELNLNKDNPLSDNNEDTTDSWFMAIGQTEIELLESNVRPRSQGFLPAKPPGKVLLKNLCFR